MLYSVKRFTLQYSAVMNIFEKDMKFPRLLDVYGPLLTERKRELLDYYYNDDYSLAEISELTGISRQGVRDSIRKSEDEINGWENTLHLIERSEQRSALLDELSAAAASLPLSGDGEKIPDLIERLKSLN